mmetsp:Transcript_14611/g.49882  ORF Transcript_14611/g.49882 Transcript_14611/m.49882 type:complete len:308 (+) Transcript_14611:1226-2149(+)
MSDSTTPETPKILLRCFHSSTSVTSCSSSSSMRMPMTRSSEYGFLSRYCRNTTSPKDGKITSSVVMLLSRICLILESLCVSRYRRAASTSRCFSSSLALRSPRRLALSRCHRAFFLRSTSSSPGAFLSLTFTSKNFSIAVTSTGCAPISSRKALTSESCSPGLSPDSFTSSCTMLLYALNVILPPSAKLCRHLRTDPNLTVISPSIWRACWRRAWALLLSWTLSEMIACPLRSMASRSILPSGWNISDRRKQKAEICRTERTEDSCFSCIIAFCSSSADTLTSTPRSLSSACISSLYAHSRLRATWG